MIKEMIIKIVNKEDLSYDETYAVMSEVTSGESSQVQNAAFLAAMSTKSAKAETTGETSGCAVAMRAHATRVEYDKPILEIVGTGGDGAKTLNISSISALVTAAAGIKVVEHSNRAASSDYGSADFLEASGININRDPKLCEKLLDEINICFLFTQHYHVPMKHVGAIRRKLGLRMVFNILGPFMNPASPQYLVLGVYDEYLVRPSANVLKCLGVERALVAYDQDKTDEISTSAPSTVYELRDGSFHSAIIKPEDFGLQRGKKEELVGGNPAENVRIAWEILSGEERGTRCMVVFLNVGAAFYIDGKAESPKEGAQFAGRLIDEGKVPKTYGKYIRLSNETAK